MARDGNNVAPPSAATRPPFWKAGCDRICRRKASASFRIFAALARAQWIAQCEAEILDCPYFHIIFTVPEPIAAITYGNKAVMYAILFRAAAETLRTIAADPKHLGAEIGFFAVLHT
jgi:hypothetical protein